MDVRPLRQPLLPPHKLLHYITFRRFEQPISRPAAPRRTFLTFPPPAFCIFRKKPPRSAHNPAFWQLLTRFLHFGPEFFCKDAPLTHPFPPERPANPSSLSEARPLNNPPGGPPHNNSLQNSIGAGNSVAGPASLPAEGHPSLPAGRERPGAARRAVNSSPNRLCLLGETFINTPRPPPAPAR